MKKFLSLVLALIMTMSLVTISAGAKDFTDDSKIQYQEAVDVMSALKVIDGYADGSFDPQGNLTRGAAAKIICNLILGPTTAAALRADTAPYKDVPVNHTFAGYIAYCQQKGIISGYADGTFRPGATLTNYAFLKMLLGALGYDAQVEGYVGDNWSIAVAKQALHIGLTDGLKDELNGTDAATREQACLYALNTLQATMVEYSAKTTVNVSGAVVTVAGSDAKPVEWDTGSKRDGNIGAKDGFIQFAEQYFGDLKLDDDARDDFARPANEWKLKAELIGTYTHTPDASYTKKVEVGDIYKDLGLGSSIAKADVEVYVDGVENASQAPVAIKKGDDDNKYGANGVLTEVFYDKDDDSVIITEINTYVGTVNKTVPAKGNKDAYVEIATESAPTGVSGIVDFETNEEFEDDAYVLYTYSKDVDEVKSLAVAESVSGTVTKAENDQKDLDEKKALTIEGERYTASKNIAGEDIGNITVKEDYTIYLDAYGYMIYIEEVENTNYALVLDAANKGTFIGKKAELLFADGTTKIVETAKDYSSSGSKNLTKKIVSYKVDDDNVYTLKAVDTTKAPTTNPGKSFKLTNDKAGIQIETGVTVVANSASVFVVGEDGKQIEDIDDYVSYTGIKNAPSITADGTTVDDAAEVYYYCRSGKMVTIMFILPDADAEVEDGVSKSVFLAKASVGNYIHDVDDGDYYEYEGTLDNKVSDEKIKVADDVTINGHDLATVDASGNVTSCVHTAGDGTGTCNSYSACVKKTVGGLYKSYNINKHGVITDLKTYDALDVKEEKGIVSATGIGTPNKAHTVWMGYDGTNDPKVDTSYTYVITADDDANVFYVDEDGEVTEIGYKGLAQDADDTVVAYVKDYLIQSLYVLENASSSIKYGVKVNAYTNATVKVDRDTIAADGETVEYEKGDEDVVITVTPDSGYTVAVTVDGNAVELDKNNQYTIKRIRDVHVVNVTATLIPAETMDIIVVYKLADGTVIESKAPAATPADTGKSYVTVNAVAPTDYVVVGEDVQYIDFKANSAVRVNFTVERKTAALTLPAGVTATWAADAAKGIAAGSASASATTQVPVGAAVTLAGITGTCGKDGAALAASSFTMPDAAKSIDPDSFGYVLVTVDSTVDMSADSYIASANVTASVAGTVAVKMGVATDVTVTLVSDTNFGTARTFTATATSGSSSVTSGSVTYPTGTTSVDITVSVTTSADTRLSIAVQ